MAGPSYIPSFYFYKFAEGISAPYTSFQAFKAGAIDQNGNLLKPESSIDPLEYLIIKLKKIFEELFVNIIQWNCEPLHRKALTGN